LQKTPELLAHCPRKIAVEKKIPVENIPTIYCIDDILIKSDSQKRA
jgi:hypothetical protein